MKNFVHLEHARVEDQLKVMQQIIEDKVCPFCPEHLAKYHKNPKIAEGDYWILTENQWPYEGAKKHLLAIAKKHAEKLSDLEPEAGAELFKLFQEEMKRSNIDGGTVAIRFGSTKYASSVQHLHAHLIEPNVEDPHHQGVKFPISKATTPQK